MAKLQPPKKVSNIVRLGLFWTIILAAIVITFALNYSSGELKDVPISEVITRANAGEISRIEGSGNELLITPEGEETPTEKSYVQGGVSTLLKDDLLNEEAEAVVDDKPPSQVGSTIWNLVLFVGPVLLIVAFFMFMMRQAQGQNNQALGFGKSKAKLYGIDKEKVSFSDIAGNDSAKQDLEEVVEFLKHAKK